MDKGGEDLHCAVLLHGELLQVILLPEGGSGTVDKGGEDLHCAVLLHGELLQVVLLPRVPREGPELFMERKGST